MQLIESKQTPKPQPSKMKTNTKLLPINKKEFTFGIQTTPQTTKSLFFGHSVSLCRARDSLSPNNPKMPLSFHFEIPSVVLSLKMKFLFFFFFNLQDSITGRTDLQTPQQFRSRQQLDVSFWQPPAFPNTA